MITQEDVIYFIVTDRFNDGDAANNIGHEPANPRGYHGGDLNGILAKTGYLKELGVTAVWITPVYVNTTGFPEHRPYHYYWAKQFDKIDKRLYSGAAHQEGSMEYLADFVQQMHARGLKVILDVVVNHGGYGIKEQNAAFTSDWFNDPSIKVQDDPDDGSLDGLPDFDHDNINVVDYFVNNLMDWIEVSKVDGLRMDTAYHVENKFWYYYKSLIKGKHPEVFLMGEVLKTAKEDIPELADYQRDYDFNSVFDFPLREQIKNCFIYDEAMYNLARPRLHPDEIYGILDLDNSSKNKIEGRGGYSNANRLVTLLDNHDLDQRIMSHARARHTGDAGKAMAYRTVTMCYAFLLTVRGIPQLYYGSEVGLEGWRNENAGGDADLRRDFPWGIMNGNDVKPEHQQENELLKTIKQLINCKQNNEALRYGVMITMWVDHFVYAFARYIRNNVVLVVFNNGYDDMPAPLGIPVIRNNDKKRQTLPDRVIDMMQNHSFINALDAADRVQLQNEKIDVQLKGKSFKIYAI
jgi:alpha-amylase